MTTDEQDRIRKLEGQVRLLTILHVIADMGVGVIIALLVGVVG